MPSLLEAPAADFVGGCTLLGECRYSWRSALSPGYFGSDAECIEREAVRAHINLF